MAGIVDDLQDAYAVFRGCATAPPEVADVLSLEECIQGLQRSWLKTRRWGSIFQLVISDILEECLLVQARLRPVALRYRPRWDTGRRSLSFDSPLTAFLGAVYGPKRPHTITTYSALHT